VTPEELRQRTSDFSRRVIRLTGPLLEKRETSDIVRQLRRSAMSVSSNYRAAGRARSHREFTAKIGIVREEADEALHWLALLRECSVSEGEELDSLVSEAEELVKIFARAFATAKKRDQEARERPSRTTGRPAADRKSDGRPNS
jgi:four helix bundle protein